MNFGAILILLQMYQESLQTCVHASVRAHTCVCTHVCTSVHAHVCMYVGLTCQSLWVYACVIPWMIRSLGL